MMIGDQPLNRLTVEVQLLDALLHLALIGCLHFAVSGVIMQS